MVATEGAYCPQHAPKRHGATAIFLSQWLQCPAALDRLAQAHIVRCAKARRGDQIEEGNSPGCGS